MRIHIASDHAGYELKSAVSAHLREQRHTVIDHGAHSYDPDDDYPAFCLACGEAVVADAGSLGIVLGGSGNGEQIAANKVDGVRAALAWSIETARLARQHNNANVVALGGRMHDLGAGLAIIDAFLAEPFSGDERHVRRIAQLTRANINALLDRAEDPEKMLNQLVRDYTASIAEARDAVAQTIGNLRLAEKDHDADVAEAKDWGNKALAASRKADQLRSGGDTAGADKWDSLAKIALTKQITAENEAKAAEPMIASQRQVVEQLKTGLQQMEVKLGELRSKRDQLIARQKTAEAQVKVQGAIRSINVLDPTSELSRYEDQVRRVEAQAAGQMELAGSSLESQFAELEASGTSLEAEARLAALKSGQNQALPGAQQQAPAQITDGDDDAINAAFAALKNQGQPAGEETSSY